MKYAGLFIHNYDGFYLFRHAYVLPVNAFGIENYFWLKDSFFYGIWWKYPFIGVIFWSTIFSKPGHDSIFQKTQTSSQDVSS